MDPLQDLAYQDARDNFERRREAIIDEATDAHYAGDEEKAQRLLQKAREMRFTGLWDEEW